VSETEYEIQEWLIPLYKGGEGSGEHKGHPFRGNGHTGGVPQAGHHNPRGDEHLGSHYHVTQAHSHIQAGNAALHAGDYGSAMRHFNEAARHGAWAGKKVMGEKKQPEFTHRDAKTTYAIAHSAGDKAQLANKSVRAYAKMLREGADHDALAMAAQKAQADVQSAMEAGSSTQSHINSVMSGRFAHALQNSQPQTGAAS